MGPPPAGLTNAADLNHCPRHERPDHDLRHLPGDYSLAQNAGWAVFSRIEIQRDAGPAGLRRMFSLANSSARRNIATQKKRPMDLRLYDTLTREKRPFAPID